jgi:hypothetical protein
VTRRGHRCGHREGQRYAALKPQGRYAQARQPRHHYCSFCGKSEVEVEKLIAGPRANIHECVRLCMAILEGRLPGRLPTARQGAPVRLTRLPSGQRSRSCPRQLADPRTARGGAGDLKLRGRAG